MGDLRHDDVAIFCLWSLGQNLFWARVRPPGVFARGGTDGFGIGHAVRGDRHIFGQWNGFQLVNGVELVVELLAQIFGLGSV